LAEVLIRRTFERPPNPFVDGDCIAALTEADRETTAAQQAASPAGPAAPAPAPARRAPRIDVRA
jgi:hypothetical protein